MQHTIGTHFSSSVFNFFLVPLSDPLEMTSSVCQSPGNTAFMQSIKFWKAMKTLVFANLQITQPSSSQLNFRNQWSHIQMLQVLLLILKDLHSFSPIFVPVLLWQCLFQGCLFIVFWPAKFGKGSKRFPILCGGGQWQFQTVFIGNIAAWIINSWNFPVSWQWWPAIWSVNILL